MPMILTTEEELRSGCAPHAKAMALQRPLLAAANDGYTALESSFRDASRRQVVLVSVADINALKGACPNYLVDAAMFSKPVDAVCRPFDPASLLTG